MNKELTIFDKTEEFEKNIRPELDKLVTLCSKYNVPFYATFCVKNNEEKSEYVSDAMCTGSKDIVLKEDRIKKSLLLSQGFNVTMNDIERITLDTSKLIEE